MDKAAFHIGDKVHITFHPYSNGVTPHWADCWTGTVIRLNQRTATVRFAGAPDTRIDYSDLSHIE